MDITYTVNDPVNYKKLLQVLLELDYVDPNKLMYGDELLFVKAIEPGNEDILQLLMDDPRIDPNIDRLDFLGKTALVSACKSNNVSAVKNLLSHDKIDINKYSWTITPLMVACKYGHIDIVRLLLADDHIEVNKTGDYRASSGASLNRTALMFACESNNNELIRLMLDDPRIDINMKDADGNTAFYCLCRYSNLVSMRYLTDNFENVVIPPVHLTFTEEVTEFLNTLKVI